MACKHSLSHTYLLSLVLMATLPVGLLGYLWISDQYRQFEEQSQAWRNAYIENHTQLLQREVINAIDYIDFERSELEQRHRQQLRQHVANAALQLDSLLRLAPGHSRQQLLQRARSLLAPIRFGSEHDHYFIYDPHTGPVLMPERPALERDIEQSIDLAAELAGLRPAGGYLEIPFAKPGATGGHRALQYAQYYRPLDIYLGAIGYADDQLQDAQQEVLERFSNASSSDFPISVIDRDGALLFNRYAHILGKKSVDNLRDGADQPLGQRVRAAAQRPQGEMLHFTWTDPRTGKSAPGVGYVRYYPGWEWTITAGLLLDKLEAVIAQQRHDLQRRVQERVLNFSLIIAALLLTAALAAQRISSHIRRGLHSFGTFFANASKTSAPIDVGQLPFVEFEQLAVDANRMLEQRGRMEKALRLNEQRFAMALDAAACHLWDMDVRDGVVAIGGSLFQQLGYSNTARQINIGQWAQWLHADDCQTVHQILNNGDLIPDSFGLELRARPAQGDYRWFSCRGGVVERDSDGRPLRALGTATEITSRKRMEQELIAARIAAEDANRAKSQFLSSISHELRTPLNGVLGYAQILLRDPSASAEQRHNLRAIESCGQHLLTLINDVLDLAKIESGKMDVRETDCDLYQLLDSVSAIIRGRADSKGLDYTLEIDERVPADICTDELKLRQILINLLGNAVKFTAMGGVTLRVATADNNTLLAFEVCDTGVGIPADKQQEIFQPFHQVGGTAGGTGLGLAISQRLCEAIGGSLSVQSTVGAGSIFSFKLPLKAGTISYRRKPLQLPQQYIDSAAAIQVMVVDDNPVNRQVLTGMLQAAGLESIEAENGEEALKLLRKRPVPLVLMDVRMPVLDGVATTRAIKSDPQLCHIIVIAVSASVFTDVVDAMRTQGCADFISKPVYASELLGKIAQHLHLPLRTMENAKTDSMRRTLGALPLTSSTSLLAAAAMGDIDTLRQTLSPLYGMSTEFVVLAQHIEQLLDNFDIEAVRDLLAHRYTTA